MDWNLILSITIPVATAIIYLIIFSIRVMVSIAEMKKEIIINAQNIAAHEKYCDKKYSEIKQDIKEDFVQVFNKLDNIEVNNRLLVEHLIGKANQ